MSTKKDGGIEHLAADHANQAGGTEREVVTDLPHKGPLCSPLAINVEYVDHAEDILDRLAVLDTAVRAAHAHIRCRTVHGATLRRVHDAALRVIGAARSPRHPKEQTRISITSTRWVSMSTRPWTAWRKS